MTSLDSNAVELHARESGAGAPLLVLHGLLGSARNWAAIVKRLAERRRVITADLRNHGDSPHHPRMDYPAMAGDLAALLDRLGIERTDVLGHSMGGKAAMLLTLTSPERIGRLIVVDIAPVSYTDRFTRLVEAMQRLPLDEIASRQDADARLAPDIPDDPTRSFLLQNLVRGGGGFEWRVDLDIIRHALPDILSFPPTPGGRFERPALFIRGLDSHGLDDQHHAAVYDRFPAARIAGIENAGHWPHIDAPRSFLKLVGDALGD
jgi:pimeloyl-ACP methyl ester carboxylesterase